MARKTVRVKIPKNIDDAVEVIEKILNKNDGSLPALPGQPVVPPKGGDNLLTDGLAKELRALYPQLRLEYNELVAARETVASRSASVQQKLGLGDGQNRSTTGTGLNLITRVVKVLLGIFDGRENEAEAWGFSVVTGEARSPVRKKPSVS